MPPIITPFTRLSTPNPVPPHRLNFLNIWLKNLFSTQYPTLLVIFLLAFLLRVNGLAFGLPYVYHDDEHQYVDAGVAFLQGPQPTLDELQKLNNPPLFKTVLGAFDWLYVAGLTGDFKATVTDPGWRAFFQYTGRLTSAAAGVLTVALLFAVGRRLYNQTVGVLAALFLAASFLPVRESHFAVNDAPLTLLVVVTLYLAAGILRRGAWFHYLAAGVAIGLAVAVKYTGVYLVTVLLAAHGFYGYRQRAGWLQFILSRRLWAGLVLIPVSFAAAAPVAVWAWPETLRRVGQLSEYGQSGYHDLLLDPAGGWIFYLKTLGWGAGWPMALAFAAAVALALFRRDRRDWLLLIFPLLLYLLMGSQQMFFVRFILPALPPLLVLVAAGLFRLKRRFGLRPATLATASILLLLQPLVMSLWLGAVLSRTDTRQQAAEWLQQNVPAGSVLYTEMHAIPRYDVTGRVNLPYIQEKEQSFEGDQHLARLQERGVQYILASDFHHDRAFSNPEIEAGRQRWLAELNGLNPVQEFQPYWLPGDWFSFDQRYGPWSETLLRRQPGPVIRVYALGGGWRWLNPLEKEQQIPGKISVFGYNITKSATGPATADVDIYWLKQSGWQETDEIRILADAAGTLPAQAVAIPAPRLPDPANNDTKLFKNQARLPLPAGDYRLQVAVFAPGSDQPAGVINLPQP